jgi:hypothetical protein
MQPPIEATLAQHLGDVVRYVQMLARFLGITAEISCGDNRGHHNLSVAHRSLDIFMVIECPKQIVT